MKYAKASMQEYLNHKNKKYTKYEHTCKKLKTNHFKCKFGDYFNDGEDEGTTEVEYEAIRKNNKVIISKIYPVFMAD